MHKLSVNRCVKNKIYSERTKQKRNEREKRERERERRVKKTRRNNIPTAEENVNSEEGNNYYKSLQQVM